MLPEKYRCMKCGRLFDSKGDAIIHAEKHVPDLIHKVRECPNCNSVLYVDIICRKCNKNKYK